MDRHDDYIIRVHFSENNEPKYLIIVQQHNDTDELWTEVTKAYNEDAKEAYAIFKQLIGDEGE